MPDLLQGPATQKEKRTGYSLAGSMSLVIHLGLFLLIGGTVIVESVIPKEDTIAEVVSSSPVDPPKNEPPDLPLDEPLAPGNPSEPQAPAVPDTGFQIDPIAINNPSLPFTVPALGAISAPSALPSNGGGAGGTDPAGTSPIVRQKVRFFNLESDAQRLGFYLDFSGTMDGDRRKKLIAELETTLKNLPDGMEVMIINWAGPAWSLDQQATDVAKFWKAASALNWSLESPNKVKEPRYFKLDNNVRKRIVKLLEETKQAPGGTDWRSPFVLAALSSTPPDTIYLMTDGQFDNQKLMLDGIDKALKDGKTPEAVVHVIGVNPSANFGKALKELAQAHKGKYTEIK